MTMTEQLNKRIDMLESEAVALAAHIEELKGKLTEAYADGGDSKKIAAELQQAQGEHEIMVKSLHDLDQKVNEVSLQEKIESFRSLKSEAEEAFKKTSSAILRSVASGKAIARKFLGKAATKDLDDRLREVVLHAVWQVTNEEFARTYLQRVPDLERAPDRDETGRRLTPRRAPATPAEAAPKAPSPEETKPAPVVVQTYVSGGPDPRFDVDAVRAQQEREEAQRAKFGSWFQSR